MVTKAEGALLTIGELSDLLDRPAHILRYWERRFPTLQPLKRAGNRRHYRPADVALARRIDTLLRDEGYTIDGAVAALAIRINPAAVPLSTLQALRDRLATALASD